MNTDKLKQIVSESFRAFHKDESGASSIEYALIASLSSVAVIPMVDQVSDRVSDLFDAVAT
ncbi:MAG: Flp family type IVb pilin, partial [Marinicaulis sp.]|nr:Flp family type IVb pilin [Marinicaulis sp.]